MVLLPNINFLISKENKRPKIDPKMLKQLTDIAILRHVLSFTQTETHAIALVQAGTQANQFASAINCAGNITNTKLKETCPLIFVSVIRKVKS